MVEKTSSVSKIAKHLNIIAKIKSFVKKSTISSSSTDSEEVSQEVANVIQVSSYNLTKSSKKDNKYTPTYRAIAEQLTSSNNQIFFASVYNLVKIAHNHTEDRDAIIILLKEQHEKNKNDKEREEYLSMKLKEIKN